MRKISVISFSIFAIAITAYGFINPNYHLQQLISTNTNYAIFRITTTVIVASYLLIPRIRTDFVQKFTRVCGALLLSFGAVTLVSPTFFGSFWSYVPLGDVFISIEGGILALLLSLEVPAGQPALFGQLATFKAKMLSQPQKLLPTMQRSKSKTTALAN